METKYEVAMRVLVLGAATSPNWPGGEHAIADNVIHGLEKLPIELKVYGHRESTLRLGIRMLQKDTPQSTKVKIYRSLIRGFKPDVILCFFDYDCASLVAAKSEGIPYVLSLNIWWPICPLHTLYINGVGPCDGPKFSKCMSHFARFYHDEYGEGVLTRRLKNSLIAASRNATLAITFREFQNRLDLIRSSDFIIVPSEFMKDGISRYGFKNIYVIHPGIDASKIEYHEWDGGKKLVFNASGYSDEKKGGLEFFDIASRLSSKIDENVEFISAQGFGTKVRGVGQLSKTDFLQTLYKSYLVILPAIWDEPFGISAIEAMAAGRPVVAYKSGGLTESVSDGKTGILVARSDRQRLAESTLFILENEDIALSMGKNGRRVVTTSFRLSTMITRYYEVLRLAVQSHSDAL